LSIAALSSLVKLETAPLGDALELLILALPHPLINIGSALDDSVTRVPTLNLDALVADILRPVGALLANPRRPLGALLAGLCCPLGALLTGLRCPLGPSLLVGTLGAPLAGLPPLSALRPLLDGLPALAALGAGVGSILLS
jgi:hypothetical protein